MGRGAHQHTLSPLPLPTTFLTGFCSESRGCRLVLWDPARWVDCRVRLPEGWGRVWGQHGEVWVERWSWGAYTAVGPQRGIRLDSPWSTAEAVVCEFPREESGVLWKGQVWAGTYAAAAIISGQGLGRESLKGLTTGQMCRKASGFVGLYMTSCTI